ncbi:MAG TPA: hypothetical protein VFL79_22395, partial [Terriglobia bacterium]|nr:hypothetical protein [Terriglobia bacterium]
MSGEPDGFIKIRNGLREHIRQGHLCPTDLGIYLFLHLEVDWGTGIVFTNASGIANTFDGKVSVRTVQDALHRLREHRYINYRRGNGQRASYTILIHKYQPTVGVRCGFRLNAFADNSLTNPVYEPLGRSPDSGRADVRTADVRNQEVLEVLNPSFPQVEFEVSGEGGAATGRKTKLTKLAEEIYHEYPRKVARQDALKAIKRALCTIATDSSRDPHFAGDHEKAASWLKRRVLLYANSPQGCRPDKTFIPHPATWFNGGRYDDDEQNWQYLSGGGDTSAKKPARTNGRSGW